MVGIWGLRIVGASEQWVFEAEIMRDNVIENDNFGEAVAISDVSRGLAVVGSSTKSVRSGRAQPPVVASVHIL